MKQGFTYKELYALFPEDVILMTKDYMYQAKDNGAKVLSYLMEYKLMRRKDGTYTCAGPDKDKIKSVLEAHHVNYLISEYGEITARKSFADNGFAKWLALAEDTPVWDP